MNFLFLFFRQMRIFNGRINAAMRLTFFILFLFAGVLKAQTPVTVDLTYQNKPLFEVLSELEKKHRVRFSYAQNRLELNKKVNVYVRSKSIDQALKTLFDQNNISYSQIGGQWALKNGPVKVTQAPVSVVVKAEVKAEKPAEADSLKKTTVVEVPVDQKEPEKPIVLSSNKLEPVPVAEIQVPTKNEALERTILQQLRTDVSDVFQSWKDRKKTGDVNVFQFSALGSGKRRSNKTNIISLSLAWGVHGSSEGIQIAGLGSAVRRSVAGLQFAGVFNGAGGNVAGLQIAGLMNSTRSDLMGLQISGMFNHANRVMGGQIGLGVNWANEQLTGTQIGGIGNVAMGSANSAQIAGGFNITKEESNFQLSAMYNRAKSVVGAQISTGMNEAEKVKGLQMGAVNRARTVNGVQLGLINFADTVNGVSLGLINIIKAGGYNKIEASFSESVHVLIGLKLGSRSMYQIYQGGFGLRGSYWGLGWGMGTAVNLNRRWKLNVESFAMHINESKKWTSNLNLMTQLRVGFEYNLDSGFGIFVGPTYNVMLSRYRSPDSGIIGSSVPMYSFYDHTTNGGTNIRMWIGCQTGMRMTLW